MYYNYVTDEGILLFWLYFIIFYTSIRGFTDGNDGLGIITPNTRYVIPQHLQELISSLYG